MLVATWTGLGRTWRHGLKPRMRWTRSWLDRRSYFIFGLTELGAGVRWISFTFTSFFKLVTTLELAGNENLVYPIV